MALCVKVALLHIFPSNQGDRAHLLFQHDHQVDRHGECLFVFNGKLLKKNHLRIVLKVCALNMCSVSRLKLGNGNAMVNKNSHIDAKCLHRVLTG